MLTWCPPRRLAGRPVAEVVAQEGCAPVVVTSESAPRFFAPAAPPTEEYVPDDGGCGGSSSGFRALFELPATGEAVVLGTSDETFGEAPLRALVDSDGDGAIEAVYGGEAFDRGMDLVGDFASTLTLAPTAAAARRLRFTAYGACD